MEPVFALLLLLLIAQAAEPAKQIQFPDCDARKDNIECYGAVGGIMNIRLMDNGSTTERCTWKKGTLNIFVWKDYQPHINMMPQRSDFFSDTGVFQMRDLSKDDTDSYTLEFHRDGKFESTRTHKLIIQAPVSSVQLKPQCLSKGEMMVTCAAEEGDNPEFSWTLNEENLTDSQLLFKNKENNPITLKQNTEGRLRCSVRNRVSEDYKELNISACGYIFDNCTINGTQISDWVYNSSQCNKQTTTSAPVIPGGKISTLSPSNQTDPSPSTGPWYIRFLPVIVGALGAVLIVGIAVVALICVRKKKCKNSKDEEHELTYADVRILQQPGRRPQPQASETVEYGQVKFSNQNQAADDSCIYAKVRR